jgi:hypothetical protein
MGVTGFFGIDTALGVINSCVHRVGHPAAVIFLSKVDPNQIADRSKPWYTGVTNVPIHAFAFDLVNSVYDHLVRRSISLLWTTFYLRYVFSTYPIF